MLFVAVEHYLCVRGGTKGKFVLEFFLEFAVVVDFAVENDAHLMCLVPHGLVGPLVEVDDGEPVESQRNVLIAPLPIHVGSAVRNGFCRSANRPLIFLVDSDDAAHRSQNILISCISLA